MTATELLQDGDGRLVVTVRMTGEHVWHMHEARDIDAAALEWFEVISEHNRREGDVDLTLSISRAKCRERGYYLFGADEVLETIFENTREVIQDYNYRTEANRIPLLTLASELPDYALVVKWHVHWAGMIFKALQQSGLTDQGVSLARFLAIEKGVHEILLAVSLPRNIFDAAVARCRFQRGTGHMGDCVYDVIVEACSDVPALEHDFWFPV